MNYVAVLVVAAAMVSGAWGGPAPFLEMYTATGSGGAMLNVTSAQPDLKDAGFNDVTKSVCGIGLWFMYEDHDYSHWSKFEKTFASPTRTCMDLDSSQYNKVSSVRYVGLDDIDFPALTLYDDKDQEGGELLVVRDLDSLPHFGDKASSFAVVGPSSWTLYHDSHFEGGTACLVPSEVDGWFYGVWQDEDIEMNNDEVSSVRKGCHTDRVFKYQVPEH